MEKLRNHNEYFMPIATPRKTCPSGHLAPDRQMYAWGEYSHTGKWRTIEHFCKLCWPRIRTLLVQHAGPCGCTITLVHRSGHSIPDWITLEE